MAQVREDTKYDSVEADLNYLYQMWSNIPQTAAEWDSWSVDEKNVFELEFALPEERLAALKRRAERDELSTEERARLRDLERLIKHNRPLVDEMFAR